MESGNGILSELPPLKTFDAFPKTHASYTRTSSRGGYYTLLTLGVLLLLILHDIGETFWWTESENKFTVDDTIDKDLRINVDMTIAMPCHYLTVDLRDAIGDRLHLSSDFHKDGTVFSAYSSTARSKKDPHSTGASAASFIQQSRKTNSAIKFPLTRQLTEEGPACRVYGSMVVKKVTGNLHVTTLGHGYMSFEHTAHEMMNLSHTIQEFSFGDYFPSIVQPLDGVRELTDKPFSIYQHFLAVVPTTYVDTWGRKLSTNQHSATDYMRAVEHGAGVPGIFFNFDIEPMRITVAESSNSIFYFLMRVGGVIGGVWNCAAWGVRVIERIRKWVLGKAAKDNEDEDDKRSMLG